MFSVALISCTGDSIVVEVATNYVTITFAKFHIEF